MDYGVGRDYSMSVIVVGVMRGVNTLKRGILCTALFDTVDGDSE